MSGRPVLKICRHRPDHDDLLIVAGFGWQADIVGHVVSQADETSTQGRAFVTGEPLVYLFGRTVVLLEPDIMVSPALTSGRRPQAVSVSYDERRDHDRWSQKAEISSSCKSMMRRRSRPASGRC